MRNLILVVMSFLAITTYAQADEDSRIYLPRENLTFSSEGIFLQSGKCTLLLPVVGFDYACQQFYLAENIKQGVTIIKCGACTRITWWVEKHCCLNCNCWYYCY